ncbi:Putative 115 kDa protein in type-1 retrotransposable element R1DM [Eumeta japonica]|uniref:115 kDa protein in type-1 retrotransposable element R1DM n=1 Tax=Eumeta variegata TaxID=151549 RepID=A0A4C1Z7X2_EUMVA|nr:Putative 115 kDa protein in type-1 retrotransposable element R1DM [Eumeta japonica]
MAGHRLKIGQLKLQGARLELQEISCRFDTILVQELFQTDFVHFMQHSSTVEAAVVNLDSNTARTFIPELSNDYCACVIVSVDINIYSPQWHSDARYWTGNSSKAEGRRAQLEGFITQCHLQVQNVEGQPYTFFDPKGRLDALRKQYIRTRRKYQKARKRMGRMPRVQGINDAVRLILSVHLPDNNIDKEETHHRQIRLAALIPSSGTPATPLSTDHLWTIVHYLHNTSPGIDRVTAKIIREVWKVAATEMTVLFGKCVMEGRFPVVWKEERLIALTKCNGKYMTDPKAYQQLMLLPVLGKTLERGWSTVTTLTTMLDLVRPLNRKYVQLVALDISAAFDKAWWPMNLVKLRERGCPPNIT